MSIARWAFLFPQSIFTISLEPTLSKIPERIQTLHPTAVPPSGTASQKFCFIFFRGVHAKIFSIKERQNFLLGYARDGWRCVNNIDSAIINLYSYDMNRKITLAITFLFVFFVSASYLLISNKQYRQNNLPQESKQIQTDASEIATTPTETSSAARPKTQFLIMSAQKRIVSNEEVNNLVVWDFENKKVIFNQPLYMRQEGGEIFQSRYLFYPSSKMGPVQTHIYDLKQKLDKIEISCQDSKNYQWESDQESLYYWLCYNGKRLEDVVNNYLTGDYFTIPIAISPDSKWIEFQAYQAGLGMCFTDCKPPKPTLYKQSDGSLVQYPDYTNFFLDNDTKQVYRAQDLIKNLPEDFKVNAVAWSDNGKRLFFANELNIYEIDWENKSYLETFHPAFAETPLTHKIAIGKVIKISKDNSTVAFSLDWSGLLYQYNTWLYYHPGDEAGYYYQSGLYLYNISKKTTSKEIRHNNQILAIEWSPNEKYLAVISAQGTGTNKEEWFIDIYDAVTLKNLWEDGNVIDYPTRMFWSSDSKNLAYSTKDDGIKIVTINQKVSLTIFSEFKDTRVIGWSTY